MKTPEKNEKELEAERTAHDIEVEDQRKKSFDEQRAKDKQAQDKLVAERTEQTNLANKKLQDESEAHLKAFDESIDSVETTEP